MNKIEWKKRSRHLRRLLNELRMNRPQRSHRFLEYNFGAVWHPSAGLWHVYNHGTQNCIATVRFVNMVRGGLTTDESRVVIRYRPKSWYADILKEFTYDVRTLHAPSNNLGRRSSWVKDQLRDRVKQNFLMNSGMPVEGAPRFYQPRISRRLRDSRGRFVSQQAQQLQEVVNYHASMRNTISASPGFFTPNEVAQFYNEVSTINIPFSGGVNVPVSD